MYCVYAVNCMSESDEEVRWVTDKEQQDEERICGPADSCASVCVCSTVFLSLEALAAISIAHFTGYLSCSDFGSGKSFAIVSQRMSYADVGLCTSERPVASDVAIGFEDRDSCGH